MDSHISAMPSSTPCHRNMEAPSPATVTKPLETRDWAALPHDILFGIFLKLGPCEIMQSAELVWTAWQRVAVEEPSLWRCIDMSTPLLRSAAVGCAVARAAVARSAGQCEVFVGRGGDDLLLHLDESTSSLKSLHLSSYDGPNEMLFVALGKLFLLEDLGISPTHVNIATENLFESVCKTCPLLRALTMKFKNVNFLGNGYFSDDDMFWIMGEEEIPNVRVTVQGEIPAMPNLRSLKLFDCCLTFEGLKSILDNCPLLETLHITGYFDDEMDAELMTKCARVKNLILPNYTSEAYDPRDYYDYVDYVDDFYIDYEHGDWDYERWELGNHCPQYSFF